MNSKKGRIDRKSSNNYRLGSKASSQMKVILALAFIGIASAVLLGAVFAATFTTVIEKPAIDGAYFSTTLPFINASTGAVTTNCTYEIKNDTTQISPSVLGTSAISHEVADVSISPLADGAYNISVYCENSADNTDNETVSRSFFKDTTPPTTTATVIDNTSASYTNNTWTNSPYVNFTALTCDDGSGSGCNASTILYCAPAIDCTPNTAFTTTIQYSTPGITYLRYHSKDNSGNVEPVVTTIIKLNTPPTATSVIVPFTANTEDDVSCKTTITDPDFAEQTLFTAYWVLYKNDSPVASGVNNSIPYNSETFVTGTSTYSNTNTAKHDRYRCEIIPWDGYANGTAVNSSELTIQNSLPTITSAAVTPDTAYTTDALTCTVSGWNDLDGDSQQYYYEWRKDGDLMFTFLSASTTNVLGAGNTTKNEVWNCTVIPYDGEANGTARSDAVTILNTASTAPLTLGLTTVQVGNTLTATCGGSTDADSDVLTYYYEFYNVNNTIVRQAWSATNTYTIVVADAHDIIQVTCRAFDETEYSANITNSTAVQNTIPTVPTTLTPTAGIFGGPRTTPSNPILISCAGSIDADSDTVFYNMEAYYYNGTSSDWRVLTSLSPGSYYWYVESLPSQTGIKLRCSATDKLGVPSDYKLLEPAESLQIDNDPPTVNLLYPGNGVTLFTSEIDFGFTSVDIVYSTTSCDLYTNDTTVASNSSVLQGVSTNITGMIADGYWEWYINCTDEIGNYAVSETRTITVNTTLIINSFTDGIDSEEDINISSGMDVAIPINFTVEITNASYAWVELNHGGICDEIPNPVTTTYNGSAFNSDQTCWVNKTKLNNSDTNGEFNVTAIAYMGASTTEANYTIYYDFERPVIHFEWWNTYDTNNVGVVLPDSTYFVTKPDIFYSPTQNTVNFEVMVTDNSEVAFVKVNLTEFEDFMLNHTTSGNCTGIIDLEETDINIWAGSCTLGIFNIENIMNYTDGDPVASFNAYFTAYDSFLNPSAYAYNQMISPPQECTGFGEDCLPAFAIVNVHDFGMIEIPEGEEGEGDECIEFGPLTTNLNAVPDMNNVNLILDIYVNLSCATGNPELPTEFIQMILMDFDSLDFSSPAMGEKMGQLADAIDFEILLPNEFGSSWIYVDTGFFEELNSTTTITINHLPFTQEPEIIPEFGAAGGVVVTSWITANPSIYGPITAGNLTFTVDGFSGYDVYDNIHPTVTIDAPSNGLTTSETEMQIDITFNGTGTQMSNMLVYVDSILKYDYSDEQDACTSVTDGSEEWICNITLTGLTHGTHNITVRGFDFGGGAAPGLNATASIIIHVDVMPPVLSGIYASDITNESAILHINTSELAYCDIWMGKNTTNEDDYLNISSGFAETHNKLVDGLEQGTLYYYEFYCEDLYGNDATSDIYTFVTAIVQEFTEGNPEVISFNQTVDGEEIIIVELNITANGTATINVTQSSTGTANPGKVSAGIFLNIESSLSNDNVTKVIYKVYYNKAKLPTNIDEDSLRLYYYNETSSKWQMLDGGVEKGATPPYVWGENTGFSEYGIFGSEVQSSSPPSGGSSSATYTTYNWEGTKFEKGLRATNKIKFSFGGQTHTVTILSVQPTYARMWIQSEKITLKVNVGDTEYVDLDGDGKDDLSVYLDRVENYVGYFTFTSIEGAITPPSPTQPPVSEDDDMVACPTVYIPVCGVDGKTYSNDCFAALAKVEIDYSGECVIVEKTEGKDNTLILILVVISALVGGLVLFTQKDSIKKMIKK